MGNLFLNVPSQAGNGAGAAVDFTTFGAIKTIVVTGDWPATMQPTINIECNNDPGQAGSWAPLASFRGGGEKTLFAAVMWIRARVTGFRGGTAPQIDIGGTDDGTVFATLVAPAGNGVGAAVDVSLLPTFKSAQVGGTFRGSVIVEFSEDGATEWAQFAAFNAGGIQSAPETAHWARVRRVGVPPNNPGLPIINLGATTTGGGAGGGTLTATNVLTFRPGSGITGPLVFDDWDDLYAKLVDLRTDADVDDSGIYTIVFDDQDGALAVPAGAYDMDRTTWIGVRWWRDSGNVTAGYQVEVTLDDGCAVANLARIEGLAITSDSADPAILVTDLQGITLEGTSIATTDAPTIQCEDGNCPIRLGDQASAAAGSIGGLVDAGVTIYLDGAHASLASNALVVGSIYSVLQVNASARVAWPMAATMTLTLQAAAGYYDNPAAGGNPNGILTAAIGTLAVSATGGTIYRNNNGATGWTSGVTVPDPLTVNNLTVNVDFNGDGTNDLFNTRLSGYFARTGTITPAALPAGETSDYDLSPGILSCERIRQATNAANSSLSGIVPIGVNGAEFLLLNLGPGTLTLLHEDASSAAANRFFLEGAANNVMGVGGLRILSYDATLARWTVAG